MVMIAHRMEAVFQLVTLYVMMESKLQKNNAILGEILTDVSDVEYLLVIPVSGHLLAYQFANLFAVML